MLASNAKMEMSLVFVIFLVSLEMLWWAVLFVQM